MAETDIKERIRQRAHDLVMQYGIRSVSMDDIANSLGISKKTIYQYYADKDELIEEIVIVILDCNQEQCNMDTGQAKDAIHEIFLARDMMAEMFRKMNPSLLFDMQKYHPAAYDRFQKHKNEFLYNVIRSNLQRGISEELYRDDLKVELVARFRVDSMLLPFVPEFQSHTRFTLAEMQEEVLDLFLYGLVTLKGHKMIAKYKQQREKSMTYAKAQ
jgi:AcrR family transcriptional regulator